MDYGQQFNRMPSASNAPEWHHAEDLYSGVGQHNATWFSERPQTGEGTVMTMSSPRDFAHIVGSPEDKTLAYYSPGEHMASRPKDDMLPIAAGRIGGDRSRVFYLASYGEGTGASDAATLTGLANIESYRRTGQKPMATHDLSRYSSPIVKKAAKMGLVDANPKGSEVHNTIDKDEGNGMYTDTVEHERGRARRMAPAEIDNGRKFTMNKLREYRDSQRTPRRQHFDQDRLF